MDQKKHSKNLSKYIEQIREFENQNKQKGNTCMQCKIDDLKKVMGMGEMSKEMGELYLKYIDGKKQQTSSFEETLKNFEEFINFAKIHSFFSTASTGVNTKQNETMTFNFPKLFNSVGEDEYGISRMIADPLNNLHKMLIPALENKEISKLEEVNDGLYSAKWFHTNSRGDKQILEFRFRSSDKDDAEKKVAAFVERLTGRQKRVYESCWAMATKRSKRTFNCSLQELMTIAYPERNNDFSALQRAEFYQDLLDLAEMSFTIEPKDQPKRHKGRIDQYKLPFITFHKLTVDVNHEHEKAGESAPTQMCISLLHNPLYESEQLYNVGAGIKNKTFELHQNDIALAEWIQIRKNQLQNAGYIIVERETLIKLANLQGTKRTGSANRQLIKKLSTLKTKGIILDFPSKITATVQLKIR